MVIMSTDAREALLELIKRLGGDEGVVTLTKLMLLLKGNDAAFVKVVSFLGEVKLSIEGSDLVRITLPPSPGFSGSQWIDFLRGQDFRPTENAKRALQSGDFKPVESDLVHQIVVLRPTFWKDSNTRTTQSIFKEGGSRKWPHIHPDAICMARACLPDRLLALIGFSWIAGIHSPFMMNQQPHLLRLGSVVDGGGNPVGNGRLLDAVPVPSLNNPWPDNIGLAWSLPPQVQS